MYFLIFRKIAPQAVAPLKSSFKRGPKTNKNVVIANNGTDDSFMKAVTQALR